MAGAAVQVFLTQEHLALVMDYAAGGNMFQYIQRHPARCLTEVQALWMFQQTIIATDFCHKLVRFQPHPFQHSHV